MPVMVSWTEDALDSLPGEDEWWMTRVRNKTKMERGRTQRSPDERVPSQYRKFFGKTQRRHDVCHITVHGIEKELKKTSNFKTQCSSFRFQSTLPLRTKIAPMHS